MENKTFMDKMVDGLKTAQTELEEFQVQLLLGKMEVTEKFSELKTSLNTFITEKKAEIQDINFQQKLEELQVQLALGKAESKEVLDEQKKKLDSLIADIQGKIEENKYADKAQVEIATQLEKLKIQLEMMQVQAELGKTELKEELSGRWKVFSNKVTDFLGK